MPSKSQTNVISTLATIQGTAMNLRAHYNGSCSVTLGKLLTRLENAVEAAWPQWKGDFTSKQLAALSAKLGNFELMNIPRTGHISIATSMCLGLMEEPVRKVGDEKLEGLLKVEAAVLAVHKYFDQRLNHWDEYVIASRACDAWREEFGG